MHPKMARIKHATREEEGDGTRLQRAIFPGRRVHVPGKATCPFCGLILRGSNLRRHIRNKHEKKKTGVPTLTSVVVSPAPPRPRLLVKIPVAEINPCNPTPGQSPSHSVTASSEEDVEEGIPCNLEGRSWEVSPRVPKTNEELYTKLAKLYANRVRMPVKEAKINYRDTVVLTDTARDQSKREELKEVFKMSGLWLHSEEELQRMLAEAEARGKAQVSKEYVLHTQAELDVLLREAESKGREAASRNQTSPEQPILIMTSTHREGEPQTVLVNTGGPWGIKITAVPLGQ